MPAMESYHIVDGTLTLLDKYYSEVEPPREYVLGHDVFGNSKFIFLADHSFLDSDFLIQDIIVFEDESTPSCLCFNEVTMEKSFLPKLTSPLVNNGDNSFVENIDLDIVGNPRIFMGETVDIGPYEVPLHIFTLTSDKLQSVHQNILTLDETNELFISQDPIIIYKDLWNQFDNLTDRKEFIRGAKIILKFKIIDPPVKLFNDKENIYLTEFEAYLDAKNLSIIFTKTQQNLGYFLSTIFDDGRYIFKFDESIHKLYVYINYTYNKGKSGKNNIVNEVRIGGSSIINW
jgi:hypothetical protein